MKKMINGIQNYAWGSYSALTEMYNIANPKHEPMAEVWMGAHVLCSSSVDIDGTIRPLRTVIANDPKTILGEKVYNRFGELPFLFKILAAAQPLSIQVHPSKAAAEVGFKKENSIGIPITAAERNYKDPNHKPELVFALTEYDAMNGFREFAEIARLLQPVILAHPCIAYFINSPNAKSLSIMFSTLLALKAEAKQHALTVLLTTLEEHQDSQPWKTICQIQQFYPDDAGLFMPLLLNVVKLQPGEAMFLDAETPHAYLHGTALEVMANSDNVLRAGLSPKYIDIPELLANIQFEAIPENKLLMTPVQEDNAMVYPIPVDDFAFSIHELAKDKQSTLYQESAAIIFCIDGEINIMKNQQTLTLLSGESVFIAANESPIVLQGEGQVARVYNKLN